MDLKTLPFLLPNYTIRPPGAHTRLERELRCCVSQIPWLLHFPFSQTFSPYLIFNSNTLTRAGLKLCTKLYAMSLTSAGDSKAYIFLNPPDRMELFLIISNFSFIKKLVKFSTWVSKLCIFYVLIIP